jgi:flavorubredoxin
MEHFHRRWMPSNRAKNDWIRRVRQLDIDMLCPQHGAVFKGDDVGRFLDWFEGLEVGGAVGR